MKKSLLWMLVIMTFVSFGCSKVADMGGSELVSDSSLSMSYGAIAGTPVAGEYIVVFNENASSRGREAVQRVAENLLPSMASIFPL